MTTVAPELPAISNTAAVPAHFANDAVPAHFANDAWLADDTSSMLEVGGSDLGRVVAASGAVEALEWQLDRASSTLASAIERAAANGCSVQEIAESAGMTTADIATLLWAARSERRRR